MAMGGGGGAYSILSEGAGGIRISRLACELKNGVWRALSLFRERGFSFSHRLHISNNHRPPFGMKDLQ